MKTVLPIWLYILNALKLEQRKRPEWCDECDDGKRKNFGDAHIEKTNTYTHTTGKTIKISIHLCYWHRTKHTKTTDDIK